MTSLVHLACRLYGTPLLIARAKLDTILAVLGPRIGLMHTELAVPITVPTQSEAMPSMPGIAVIPIHGTLVRRAVGLDAASGLTSYARIAADIIVMPCRNSASPPASPISMVTSGSDS